MHSTRNKTGFTIIEVVVSVTIVTIVLGVAMRGFIIMMKSQQQAEVQNELDVEVQWAIERLKKDIRLSSLDRMFFNPVGGTTFEAISFPLARDDDGDGAVDVDDAENIIWDRTVIYHVWDSSPNELRITTFDPRDNGLSEAQRQAQLDSVVSKGNGSSSFNGDNASTRTIFRNLFEWEVRPRGSLFDSYAPEVSREVNVNLGACILGPGEHIFGFRVIGKNAASAGYGVAVDSLTVSACGAPREAEDQLPASSYHGTAPVRAFRPDGSWNGNHELLFEGDAAGDYFELTMCNDRWEETNFDASGHSRSQTVVRFDETASPKDFVVQLAGNTNVWHATEQTGDPTGVTAPSALGQSAAVRAVIKGEEMVNGNWVRSGGAACKVAFRAGQTSGNDLHIGAASIAECASSTLCSPDAVPGTAQPLTFSGNAQCIVPQNTVIWSDLTDFSIDATKSYVVTFHYDATAPAGVPWMWSNVTFPAETNTFVIPATNSLAVQLVSQSSWSTQPGLSGIGSLVGVSALYATHGQEGTYTSRILDTQMDRPDFTGLEWNAERPSGTQVAVKLRTGDSPDLSDAPPWSNAVTVTVSGALLSVAPKRFVQYQLLLGASPQGLDTPMVKDLTLAWDGPGQMVDVAGTFTRGPAYGQVELTVDGRTLRTGVSVDLELYRDVRAFNMAGSQRLTSAAAMTVMPRNTGL